MKVNTIGDYDRRFRFEQNKPGINPVGNAPIENWVTVCEAWGKFKPISSKETFEGQQQVAGNQVQIQTRYVSGIDEMMRFIDVLYGGVYDINNVQSDKRDDYLIIKGTKRDNK